MTTLLSVLIFIVALLLTLVVLIQNSKGGGLDANLAAQSQILGAAKTTEVVEKVTWWLIGLLMLFSVITTKITAPAGGDFDYLENTEMMTQPADTDGEE